jgi:hypothetical protein
MSETMGSQSRYDGDVVITTQLRYVTPSEDDRWP